MCKLRRFIIIIIILLLPFMVSAEECNSSSIEIKDINVKDKSKYVEELSKSTIKDNKINLDLKMYDIGDYIEYELKVKNESKENFYFDEKSLNINSVYFDYSLSYKDNSNRIEPNTEKTIYLKVKYNKEVEKENFFSGKYKDNNIVSLLLTDNKKSVLSNPLTGSNKIILLLISMIILGIYLYYKKTNNLKLNIFILFGLSLLIPISTYALCEVKLEIDSDITIGKVKPNPCTYDGELVQGAEYVNGQYTYRYMQDLGMSSGYDNNRYIGLYDWINIEYDGWGVVLNNKSSAEPVTTKLCSSINNKPIVSTKNMFQNTETTQIDLCSFDTQNVIDMSGMFFGTYNINEINLENFDTSNVINMNSMFSRAGEDSETFTIIGLGNLDTSKVKEMEAMFSETAKNSTKMDLGDLSNLNTSNVESMRGMFYNSCNQCNKWQIEGLSKWNTEKVKNFHSMFFDAGKNATIWDIGDLTDWNVSSATDFSQMFLYAGSNALHWDIGSLSEWDTSNAVYMRFLFSDAGFNSDTFKLDLSNWDMSNVIDISGMFYSSGKFSKNWSVGNLSNWNTSKVTNMVNLFGSSGYNSESWNIGNISNWDTSNVTNMYCMFYSAGFNATTWNIGDLSNWNTSKVTDMEKMFYNSGYNAESWNIGDISNWNTSKAKMIGMFSGAGKNAVEWSSIGTLNVYASNINGIFSDVPNAKAIINIRSNPSKYNDALTNTATLPNSEIIVNYSRNAISTINKIVNTRTAGSNVILGSLLD